MVSVNLIFHIVSAFTFIVLIWYLLQVQAQLMFLRDLMRSLAGGALKLRIDWPEAFLKRFAEAQGIRFKSNGEKLAPQKIDLKLWAELHCSVGLEAIEWAAPSCRLQVRQDRDLELWRNRLEKSFQDKIAIEWDHVSSKRI